MSLRVLLVAERKSDAGLKRWAGFGVKIWPDGRRAPTERSNSDRLRPEDRWLVRVMNGKRGGSWRFPSRDCAWERGAPSARF